MRGNIVRLAACLAVVSIALVAGGGAQAVGGSVVISQVYGGGGNSGATFKNDFIELYNPGTAAVDLGAWSVQYAATTGTTWQRTNLSGTLAPGAYYLIQEAAGAGGTTDLPTPNAAGSIAMAAGAGKVALVSSQTTIATGTLCPSAPVDLVGYGTTTTCFEGKRAGADAHEHDRRCAPGTAPPIRTTTPMTSRWARRIRARAQVTPHRASPRPCRPTGRRASTRAQTSP